MEEEADAALNQLHHAMDVHHRLLIPPAQVGTHLRLQVLQLACTETSLSSESGHASSTATSLFSHTSGVCRLLRRPWTYLSSSSLKVSQVKE